MTAKPVGPANGGAFIRRRWLGGKVYSGLLYCAYWIFRTGMDKPLDGKEKAGRRSFGSFRPAAAK